MKFCYWIISACFFFATAKPSYAQLFEASPVDMTIEKTGESELARGFSSFWLPNHFVWCGSAIKSEEDGKFYLFYSAMNSGPAMPPFVDAWIYGSKIGVAVSDSPYGGFLDLGFVMNKDGYLPDSRKWDSQTVSNTHIKRFGNRYYLYYCGSVNPDASIAVKGKLSRRDRIQQNQKLGVVSFASIDEFLKGNYKECDAPLLEPRTRVKSDNVLSPSPQGTTPMPDNLVMVNPSVVYNPKTGKYLLYFKGNVYDPTWRGVHGVAISDAPDGPFKVLDQPVFEYKNDKGIKFNAEDPFVWYHRKDSCFYAVMKDFNGSLTLNVPGLAIMESIDGINWNPTDDPLFMKKELKLRNGKTIGVDRLERPQLLLDDNDDPIVLYSACSITPLNKKRDGSSFNIQIPIRRIVKAIQ